MKVFRDPTFPGSVINLLWIKKYSHYVLIFFTNPWRIYTSNLSKSGASTFLKPALLFSNDLYCGHINQSSLHQ